MLHVETTMHPGAVVVEPDREREHDVPQRRYRLTPGSGTLDWTLGVCGGAGAEPAWSLANDHARISARGIILPPRSPVVPDLVDAIDTVLSTGQPVELLGVDPRYPVAVDRLHLRVERVDACVRLVGTDGLDALGPGWYAHRNEVVAHRLIWERMCADLRVAWVAWTDGIPAERLPELAYPRPDVPDAACAPSLGHEMFTTRRGARS